MDRKSLHRSGLSTFISPSSHDYIHETWAETLHVLKELLKELPYRQAQRDACFYRISWVKVCVLCSMYGAGASQSKLAIPKTVDDRKAFVHSCGPTFVMDPRVRTP